MSFEQFIGEEIPSLEEHQQRDLEWINSLPKDPITERPEFPDNEIGRWRLSILGQYKMSMGDGI